MDYKPADSVNSYLVWLNNQLKEQRLFYKQIVEISNINGNHADYEELLQSIQEEANHLKVKLGRIINGEEV